MIEKSEFVKFNINGLGFKSKQDLIENLYLRAILNSYKNINHTIADENDIRDRFIFDFYHNNGFTKDLIQNNILHINWERWVFKNKNDLGRADLSFELTGLDFIIECKKLKFADQKYITDGLNRFLNNEYSSNESTSGMIGFVISGDIIKIKEGLLKKCKNVKFINSKFSNQKLNWNYNFQTTHSRINNSNIDIYHLFFEFHN